MKLRDYQHDIINQARTLMAKGVKRILITAPTGSGKTVLTASMMMGAAEKKNASIFIVHRRELIKQSTATFSDVGVRHGIIAAGFEQENDPYVQLASIDTLRNRLQKIKEPKVIIWDECHHIAAAGWELVFKTFPNAVHIGVTATPERLDGKGLGKYFTHMILGPTVAWLIDQGYLSKYIIFCPPGPSLVGVHKRMGDYVKSEIAERFTKPTIMGDSVKLYLKHSFQKRAVVFAPSVKHSSELADVFNASNIRAHHVDGETESDVRDTRIKDFKRGAIDVLLNVGLFGEGFDVPAIETVIDCSPTLSLGAYLQRFGRALRPVYAPGMPLDTKEERLAAIEAGPKKFAIYIDQAGNVMEHGLPDDEREWSLDGRDVRKKQSGDDVHIRVCKKCAAAMPSQATVCAWCGTIFPIQHRVIEQVEGDLVQIDPEELRRNRKREQGTAETEEQLIELGKKRGYKRPELWARHLILARGRKK